jgi:3-oxoadipate enol-lactonase
MPKRTINGAALYYEEAGAGAPIVLLHGFPLDSRIWIEQRSALSDRYRAVTPDLRGFGPSADASSFTIESLADDVHALLKALNVLPCILGGLSMGGYVALAYVKKYATDLRGLMLIDTRAEGDSPEGRQGRDKMIQLARDEGSRAVADQMMPKMLAPDEANSRPAVAKQLRAIMESCPALTIEHALAAMRDRDDYTAFLASIAVPTLILVGDQDAITPPAVAEKMHRHIPRSVLEIIKGSGHMSPMEQPQQVTVAMQRFIAEYCSERL